MAMERQAELQQQHNMHRLQTSFQVKNQQPPPTLSSCSHILCPNDPTPSPLQPLLFPTLSDLPSWAQSGFGQHTQTHTHNGSIHSCGLGCVFGGCLPWAIWGWVWVRARWGGGMSGGLACENVSGKCSSIIIFTQINAFNFFNFFYQSLDYDPCLFERCLLVSW